MVWPESVTRQALKARRAIEGDDSADADMETAAADMICYLLHLGREVDGDPIDIVARGIFYWAAEEAGAQQEADNAAAQLTGAPIPNPDALDACEAMEMAMAAKRPSLADVIRQCLNEATAQAEVYARP